MDLILEQAKLDFTVYLRDCVDKIMIEWESLPGQRKPLGLFLEFNFPFVNLGVQKKLRERHPESKSASDLLKANPQYPIAAYLLAEATAWIACKDKHISSSLFPITELAEWYVLNDLKWYSELLIAVTKAIEKQTQIGPDTSMPKLLQNWCLQRDKLRIRPSRWLEGTPEGDGELKKIKRASASSTRRRIPIEAAQENERRRKIFGMWEACWRAELRALNFGIRLRERGSRG